MQIAQNSISATISEPRAIRRALDAARHAQGTWRQTPIRVRAATARRFAHLLASRAQELVEATKVAQRIDRSQTISSEIIPLADAARWLSRRASRILATRWLGMRDRSLWVGRLSSSIHREPWGVVLVLGASNYPLFLTGVQMLQALVAGNAVCVKPAPGTEEATQLLVQIAKESGIPSDLIVQIGSDPNCGETAIAFGVDKVVLTGSSSTGRKIAQCLAPSLIPSVLELGGCDSMIILSSANLSRVLDAIRFGLRWNSGATCIAPRRAMIMADRYHELVEKLEAILPQHEPQSITVSDLGTLRQLVRDAMAQGAVLLGQQDSPESRWMETYPQLQASEHGLGICKITPVVLKDVQPTMKIAQTDVFAPLLMLMPVSHWSEAIRGECYCSYALGSSIFGEAAEAEMIAQHLPAGCVTINDLIAPTADPRIPFGGRGASGYGVTRGAEGLLEMTRTKSICRRKGKWLPHFHPPVHGDDQLFLGMLQFLHGARLQQRWQGLMTMFREGMRRHRNRSTSSEDAVN